MEPYELDKSMKVEESWKDLQRVIKLFWGFLAVLVVMVTYFAFK
jgi:hypothetical protein